MLTEKAGATFRTSDAQLEMDARLEVIWDLTGPKSLDDAQTPGGLETPNTCQTLGDWRISNRRRHQAGGSSGGAALYGRQVDFTSSRESSRAADAQENLMLLWMQGVHHMQGEELPEWSCEDAHKGIETPTGAYGRLVHLSHIVSSYVIMCDHV